jgi:hypothetical protein
MSDTFRIGFRRLACILALQSEDRGGSRLKCIAKEMPDREGKASVFFRALRGFDLTCSGANVHPRAWRSPAEQPQADPSVAVTLGTAKRFAEEGAKAIATGGTQDPGLATAAGELAGRARGERHQPGTDRDPNLREDGAFRPAMCSDAIRIMDIWLSPRAAGILTANPLTPSKRIVSTDRSDCVSTVAMQKKPHGAAIPQNRSWNDAHLPNLHPACRQARSG